MPAPPGREPDYGHPVVAGLDDEPDDDLKQSTAELAAWIDYLQNPQDHEGPALVRLESIARTVLWEGDDNNRGWRDTPPDDAYPYAYDLVTVRSVLWDVFDVDKLFEAARMLGECETDAMEPAYQKYLTGYLCVADDASGQPGEADLEAAGEDVRYPMESAFKTNLIEMRKAWVEPASYAAHEWENDWIRFAVGNENCFFVMAEALVRYRALYLRARQELAEATKGLTRRFHEKMDTPDGSPGDGPNWASALTAGVGVMMVTVITGGTGAMALGSLALGAATALGQEAVSGEQHNVQDPGRWSELVERFHDEVTTLMRNLAHAIDDVRKEMVADFNAIRETHGGAPPEPDKSIRRPPDTARDINPEYLAEGVERYIDQPIRDSLQPNIGKYSEARSLTGADPGWYPYSSSVHPDVVNAAETFLNLVTELATDALDGHADMVGHLHEYGADLKYVADTARASDNYAADVLNRVRAELEDV